MQSLHNNEQNVRFILNSICDGIISTDINGVVSGVNPAAEVLIGWKEDDALGKRFEEVFVVIDEKTNNSSCGKFLDLLKTAECFGLSNGMLLKSKDGKEYSICASASPLFEDMEIRGLVVLFRDISKEYAAKKALQDSEKKYRMLAEGTNDIMYSLKTDGVIEYIGPQITRYGYIPQQMIGNHFSKFILSDDFEKLSSELAHTFQTGEEFPSQFRLLDVSGNVHWLEECGKVQRNEAGEVTGLIGVLHDITDRKSIEEQLIQAEKMSAVGTLASGIAHEFNNINAIIKGHIDLILSRHGSVSDDVRKQMLVIQRAVNRGATITSDLLTYSSESKNGFQKIKFGDIVQDVLNLVQKEFESDGIKIFVNKDNDQHIYLNPDRMSHVIMNMMINAKHAMVDSEKKIIAIDFGKQNEMFFFKITDTGCGIDSIDLKKIFTPFFTTKGEYASSGSSQKHVKGCGLGLAVCHTIITKHHRGRIEVNSEVGKGTTITVFIPDLKVKEEGKDESVDYVAGKGERLLILEDEEALRQLIKSVLDSESYDVFTTDSGEEALNEHLKNPFELVIVDLKMPNMSGEEFLKMINECKQKTPVKIVLTGRTMADVSTYGIYEKIAKPFDFPSLLLSIYRGLKTRGGKHGRSDS